MDLEFFRKSIAEIAAHSLVAPDRVLRCIIIANPAAGGYTIRRRWKMHEEVLAQYRQKARANHERNIWGKIEILLTNAKGSGEKIAQGIIAEASSNLSPFYLIIIAGGDGTNLDVLSAIYSAPAHIRSNMGILRLPMGTGNDGADSHSLAEALDLLVKPAGLYFAPALHLETAPSGPAKNKGPFLAFNILSMGLDAFVTGMTNKMKGKMPGDTYKLWVDIASLFYTRLYKVGYLDVNALDEQGRETFVLHEKLLLLAMGASGHRTYGAGKKILPDERNVCAFKDMSLFEKAALKKLAVLGKHAGRNGAFLFNGHRLEISGRQPILAQMDGETILLQPEDFPAVIELTSPVIPLLKPKTTRDSNE